MAINSSGNNRLSGTHSLAYLGVDASSPPQMNIVTRAPTINDWNGFNLGDLWLDSVTEGVYILVKLGVTPFTNMRQATWVLFTGGTGTVTDLTGNSGGLVPPLAGNINVIGDTTTINVVGNPATNTLTISALGAGSFTWVDVTAATQAMVVNTGYTADRASIITFTLPIVAAYGTIIRVCGKGTGLYTIAQNAGQTIHFVNNGPISTTTGVTGSLSSGDQYGTVELLCSIANTDFTILSMNGNFTPV
jgi:hypothetical protein